MGSPVHCSRAAQIITFYQSSSKFTATVQDFGFVYCVFRVFYGIWLTLLVFFRWAFWQSLSFVLHETPHEGFFTVNII
jgi:hypothetical protein